MAPREVSKWNIVLVWNAFCWRVRIRKISPVVVVFPKPAWQIIFWQTISLYCVGFLFNTLVRPVLDYSQTMKFTWFRDAATQWMQGKVADLESMVSIFDSLHKLTWTCYHNEDIVLQHCLRFTNEVDRTSFCWVLRDRRYRKSNSSDASKGVPGTYLPSRSKFFHAGFGKKFAK